MLDMNDCDLKWYVIHQFETVTQVKAYLFANPI